MRTSEINRNTNETKIALKLNLDGTGRSSVATGCGFLDHMLTLFARHSRFDLDLNCEGDTWVDYHHTVEDVGICLGQAFSQCIGDKKGIVRYGDITLLGFVREARVTLHFKQLAGKNTHHIIEGMFKAFGRAMRKAAAIDPDFAEDVPSTKGVL